jgi:hypothetical protein
MTGRVFVVVGVLGVAEVVVVCGRRGVSEEREKQGGEGKGTLEASRYETDEG